MFKVGMQWGMSWFEGTSSQKPSFKLLRIFLKFLQMRSTLRKQRYMQYFISTRDRRNQFDMCASIFVCMWWEGASGAPRSQRYLPCVTSVTMGDHPPSPLLPHVGVTDMWETTSIYGSQWQMGVSTAYGQNLEIPAILWSLPKWGSGIYCLYIRFSDTSILLVK